MVKKTPLLVLLTPELKAGLEDLQRRTGSSLAELVRQAVRAYLIIQQDEPAMTAAPRQRKAPKRKR